MSTQMGEYMEANSLKKGMRVQLRCGWYGTMADNKKGNIRTATVEGIYTEMGSIYAKDIARVQLANGTWEVVTLSDAQQKSSRMISALGF